MRGFNDYDNDYDRASEFIDYECVVCSTDRAILFRIERNYEIWIPKSLIADLGEIDLQLGNTGGRVEIPRWFARDNGLL